MAAPSTYHSYGGSGVLLEDYAITGKLHGLDVVRATLSSASVNGVAPGSMLPSPLPNLKIREVETKPFGAYFRHQVDAIGVIGSIAGSMPGFPQWSYNSDGWDTYTDKRISPNRQLYQPGQSGGLGGIFFCTNSQASEIEPGIGWYEVTGSFAGLSSNKPRLTTVTVNGATYSGDSITVNLPGGWNTPRKGTVDLPEVVVSQRFLSSTPPPTAAIPGNGRLGAMPPVKAIYLFGANIVEHWPNGWAYDNITSSQLLDKALYDVTISFKYKHRYTW